MRHELYLRVAGVTLYASAQRPFDVEEGFARFSIERGLDAMLDVNPGGVPPRRPWESRSWDSGRGWTVSHHEDHWDFRVAGAENGHPPPMWMRIFRKGRQAVAHVEDDRPRIYNILSVPLGPLLLLHHLHGKGGLLLHGCGVRWGGLAWAFPARSGGGKTTLADSLATLPDIEVLSDDTLALLPSAAGWTLHGTPWSGHPEHASPAEGRLEAIGFLRKGSPAAVRPISQGEFMRRLLARLFVPWWLPDAGARCIEAARKVTSQVEGRLVTLPATPAAAQFVVRAFAGRESTAQTDATR